MNKIDTKKALAQIEAYLREIDMLEGLSYEEGQEKYYQLHSKVESFVRLAFDDAEDKLRVLNAFVAMIVPALSAEEERRRKNQDYQDDLQKLQRQLLGYKEEISLAVEFAKTDIELGEIERETKEAYAESRRREAVAETKAYGAFIEVIDMLRSELRHRGETAKSVREIKEELVDMKKILVELGNAIKALSEKVL